MKWSKWLENWDMTSLKVKTSFLEMEFNPAEADKDAAWELYVELLTRIATQSLGESVGDEQSALESVYSLFPTTRAILKAHGRDCVEFTKLAVIVLNQIVRPFTAKWHRVAVSGGLSNAESCTRFREELEGVQGKLIVYTKMLSDMAGVEDLTQLEG